MPSLRRTRFLALVGAVSAVAFMLPAQASSSGARLTDPAGDIAVPSLDIVSGAIRLDASHAARTLTMTATMTGDLTGVPADYDLVTGVERGSTCYSIATRVRWNGVALESAYSRSDTDACHSDVTTADLMKLAPEIAEYAATGDAITATAAGRTVTVTLPAPTWLSTGSLAGFGVSSHTPVLGVSTDNGLGSVGNFDLAGIEHPWRVG